MTQNQLGTLAVSESTSVSGSYSVNRVLRLRKGGRVHLSPPKLFFSHWAPALLSLGHAALLQLTMGSVVTLLAVQRAVSGETPIVASQEERQERRVVTVEGCLHAASASTYIERMKEHIHFFPISWPPHLQSSLER